jgi:hypothetical protein
MTRELAHVKMKWKWKNPPVAPHFGGVRERLIKIVKKSLYAVLNEKVPKEVTLQNNLAE